MGISDGRGSASGIVLHGDDSSDDVEDSSDEEEAHSGPRCGTFGCTLPDKHQGLHRMPDLGKRKRDDGRGPEQRKRGKQQQQQQQSRDEAPRPSTISLEAFLPATR